MAEHLVGVREEGRVTLRQLCVPKPSPRPVPIWIGHGNDAEAAMDPAEDAEQRYGSVSESDNS